MRRHIKKYMVPHADNDHKPHLLRTGPTWKLIGVIAVVELAILLLILPTRPAVLTEKLNNMAAIFPSVLVQKTNETRLEESKNELAVNDALVYAAQMKADDMAKGGYFAHTSPDGKSPWYWLQTAGYKYKTAGENLAVNFVDSTDVHNAWMNSPTHRANIERDGFSEIGIATAQGTYKGKKAVFVVQFFGAPAERGDTFAQMNVVAVSSLTPKVQATTSTTTIGTEVLGAEVIATQETFASTSAAEPVPESVPEISEDISLLAKIVSSPKATLSVALWLLAVLVSIALFLKVFVKVRIQYPKLILNGMLVLGVLYLCSLLNQYVLTMVAEII